MHLQSIDPHCGLLLGARRQQLFALAWLSWRQQVVPRFFKNCFRRPHHHMVLEKASTTPAACSDPHMKCPGVGRTSFLQGTT